MGVTKTKGFTKNQLELASMAKALAHPARIAILQFLAGRNDCICGDIVDMLPLSQSTVSQHLKALKRAGLITGEVEGPSVCYCINPAAWRKAQAAFSRLFVTVDNKTYC